MKCWSSQTLDNMSVKSVWCELGSACENLWALACCSLACEDECVQQPFQPKAVAHQAMGARWKCNVEKKSKLRPPAFSLSIHYAPKEPLFDLKNPGFRVNFGSEHGLQNSSTCGQSQKRVLNKKRRLIGTTTVVCVLVAAFSAKKFSGH